MLRVFSEFTIALIELVEAELQSARKKLFGLGLGLAFLSIATVLIVAAFALIIYTIYLLLTTVMYTSTAVFTCSLILLLLAGICLWLAKSNMN